jgi:hypothetical protein
LPFAPAFTGDCDFAGEADAEEGTALAAAPAEGSVLVLALEHPSTNVMRTSGRCAFRHHVT